MNRKRKYIANKLDVTNAVHRVPLSQLEKLVREWQRQAMTKGWISLFFGVSEETDQGVHSRARVFLYYERPLTKEERQTQDEKDDAKTRREKAELKRLKLKYEGNK